MAFGIHAPAMGEWIINLGEAAEYMFDHNIFQDNLVGVDFCEQMVRETNPSVWDKAQKTPAPHAELHGYRTIAEIMTALRLIGYDHVVSIEHEDALASVDEGLANAVRFLRPLILTEQPAEAWWV